ncbi:unnamed protein product [Taenia asiatica]|uniref:HTH psq-type domain-containing protein n=1 Tax=Taenia asiatica TaxID=60517 RepID=A0A0R3W630_TAEAS|nr:unnamed protein product [Taenia asiatica]
MRFYALVYEPIRGEWAEGVEKDRRFLSPSLSSFSSTPRSVISSSYMDASQDTLEADPTAEMSKQVSGSGGADWNGNINSEIFFGHFKRILSNYIPLFRLMFETQHTTNDSRLVEVFQRESVDGCLFPYLSSTRYLPVPPPAVLSCYLRISGHQSHETYDRMLRTAAASKAFNRNDLLSLTGVFQFEGKDLDPAVIRCAVEANGPYTASELASAVRAICSGQLGTRRAASMYGIPRSTLRNKICKLNEIRKHEETMRGGKPISLSDFFHQFTSSEKLPSDPFHRKDAEWRSSSVALPYGLASVFKVNCRTTPSEWSNAASLRTFFGKNDVWSMEHSLSKMETKTKGMKT